MSSPHTEHGNIVRGTLRRDNFELGYSIEGAGQPMLVIGSAIYYPRTFSAGLRRHRKLIFIDHRGFAPVTGEIAPGEIAPGDYELDAIVEDIEAIRRHLELEKVVVIGHSGHGYMALEYAKKFPQNVTHLVMIATGPSQSDELRELTERHWEEAVCPERKAQLENDLQQLGAELAAAPEKRFITFCRRLGARSWFDPAFDATPLWEGVGVNMEVIDYLWGEVFRDIEVARGLDGLNRPVMLALGRFDYLVAPYFAWEPYRKNFHNLTVRIFDRSSHTPQLEESELFDAELLRWLDTA